MHKISFTEGVEVYYKHHFGVVRFVCEKYITVCTKAFPGQKVKDVCLLIYPENYHLVTLEKESTK
jgi:hypothetical protein